MAFCTKFMLIFFCLRLLNITINIIHPTDADVNGFFDIFWGRKRNFYLSQRFVLNYTATRAVPRIFSLKKSVCFCAYSKET